MFLTLFLLVVGLGLVLAGADKLTDGAAGLACKFRASELAIGLTVVAFGTSMPEFVVSFVSALKGNSGISIGNVVGSNTFNALAIVGCAALARPIVVSKSTVRKDIPFAIMATLVLIVTSQDSLLEPAAVPNCLSRTDGLIMLGFFSVFMAYTFSMARKPENRGNAGQAAGAKIRPMSNAKIAACVLPGLSGLAVGGNLFVDSASEIALRLGVSEAVIGLTLVAASTSLPQLATSIVAARKGCSAIAIGNVIGSNIFNIFFVMGFCAAVSPMPVGDISATHLNMMLLSMLMLLVFSCTNRVIERWEGGTMLTAYLVYLACLVMNAA